MLSLLPGSVATLSSHKSPAGSSSADLFPEKVSVLLVPAAPARNYRSRSAPIRCASRQESPDALGEGRTRVPHTAPPVSPTLSAARFAPALVSCAPPVAACDPSHSSFRSGELAGFSPGCRE